MPTDIKLKNSVTASSAPISLQQGEVAINITDKKVWVGNAAGTPIQLLGAGGSASFGALTCTSLTNSGLTSGRVTYATTAGLLTDSANMTFNGTTLTVNDLTDSSLTAGRVVFPTTGGNLSGSANFFWDNTNGNLGIGTASPAAPLDVVSNSGATGVSIRGRSSDNIGVMRFYSNNGATQYAFVQAYSSEMTIGMVQNSPMTFYTNNTERMRITSGGDVAIGATGSLTGSNRRALVINSPASQLSILELGVNGTLVGYMYANTSQMTLDTAGGTPMTFITNGSERMRLNTSGAVILQGGNTSANGVGIAFPATQSASSDANTLDDYEEGTWTPTLTGSGSNPTVTYAVGNTGGRYTKIGNIVVATFEVRWTALSGGSGIVYIAGFPFARLNVDTPDGDRCIIDSYNNTLSGIQVIGSLGKNATTMNMYLTQSAGATTDLSISNLGTSGVVYLRATITYFTS